MIIARGIRKIYDDRRGKRFEALRETELEIARGEVLCLLGPSGCGKSTLLNILAGFENPTSGTVTVDGITVRGPDPRRILLFQEYGLFPWLSALGNVAYGLKIKGLPRQECREKAMDMLRMVGLDAFADNHPHELSGGMQQRVAIARALAVDPELIFMDEPFGALDSLTRLRMQDELEKIRLMRNQTMVFVSHDIAEAVYLSDRIAIMSPSPGQITMVIQVPLTRPRSRTSQSFTDIQDLIYSELKLSNRLYSEYTI
ncbi:MAG: ABC transporter ATP-binding protein [Smithellaceae bacterium]|nr:ABC transporter ATP-binding protein [Smithellaceae bacterium]